ncbi:hypothetical protein GCM10008908_12800 [Clostridium subterminale]|uniref:Uncharacterized protein n=1 Tax=Clostridium subterminale TaxID=1550 RepID=A0ABP3VYK5_CLOSU
MEDNKLLEKNKKVKKRIIIGFIVLILLNLWGLIKVNSLRQDLDSLRGDIYNQYNDMRTSLSSINTIVEENLKKQGSILSDFSYSVEGLDIENKAIIINLKGTPKIYKEGLKFYFNYECSNGDNKSVEGKLDKALNYSAKITVPIRSSVKFRFTLDYGEEVKKEIWEDEYIDRMEYQLQIMPQDFKGEYKTKGDEVIIDGRIECRIYPSSIEENRVEEALCKIRINEEVIDEIKLEKSNEVSSEYSHYTGDLKENYKLKNGDMLDVLVEVQDTYGFKYKYYSMTVINNNGSLNKWGYSGGNAVIQIEP